MDKSILISLNNLVLGDSSDDVKEKEYFNSKAICSIYNYNLIEIRKIETI